MRFFFLIRSARVHVLCTYIEKKKHFETRRIHALDLHAWQLNIFICTQISHPKIVNECTFFFSFVRCPKFIYINWMTCKRAVFQRVRERWQKRSVSFAHTTSGLTHFFTLHKYIYIYGYRYACYYFDFFFVFKNIMLREWFFFFFSKIVWSWVGVVHARE